MSESAAIDFLLDGLEAALELERDLGARTLEVDRSLLVAPQPQARPQATQVAAPQVPLAMAVGREGRERHEGSERSYDFVFLHERALSPGGVEMMAKIVVAMGKTEETAPVVIVPPLPKAKIFVALGVGALRKFFPGLRGSPGQWLKAAGGHVLVSNSPEEILRFGTVTPAVQRIKQEMWRNLKVVMQRARQ